MSQKLLLLRKVLLFSFLFITAEQSTSQVSISGPTCVVAGLAYNYNVTGEYDPSSTIEWCPSSNGSINQVYGTNPASNGSCKSATGGNYMVMTFNTSGSGTVYVTTSGGTANLNVTVVTALNPGSISNTTQNIAYNTTASVINCSVATYGACSPSYTYKWQSSTDGVNWSDMSQTTQNLSASSSLLTTTYFRRMVTETSTNTVSYSNTATVFVALPFSSVTISPAQQDIYTGTSPSAIGGVAASGGNCSNNYTYTWEYSIDGGNTYYDVINGSGGNGLVYTPPILTQTIRYRRKDVCGSGPGSELSYSNVAIVNVYQHLSAGIITPAALTITYNTNPGYLAITNPTGGICDGFYVGGYQYQWQSSTDGINYSDIPGAPTTFLNYSPGKLTASTYYRRRVICGETAYSNAVLVTVNPQVFPGNIIPGAINIPQNTSPGKFTVNAASGGACNNNFDYAWEQSTDGVTFTPISNATGQHYTPGMLSSTTYFRRKVTCGIDELYSNVCKVTINTGTALYNYIQTRDIVKPGVSTEGSASLLNSLVDVKQTTQYFDGLGRPIQTVSWRANPQNKDMVNLQSYDEYGREVIKYLPYAATTGDGIFKSTALIDQKTFNTGQFADEEFHFGVTQYEASPLGRVVKAMAPGNSWVGADRGVSQKYWGNKTADAVRLWTVSDIANNFGSYASSTTYPADRLFKNVSIDEGGKQVVEFKDKDGKVLLKKVQLTASADNGSGSGHSGWLCTYYIYDHFNQLRAVVQPKAVKAMDDAGNWSLNATAIDELLFRYEYDSRGRMTMKKVPGAGPVYMIFDARDRLVFTQDANMRSSNQWLTTLYDAINRPVLTGMINYTATLSTFQNEVTQQTANSGGTVSADLILSILTSGVHQASNSITLDPGFESGTEFTAEIIAGGGSAIIEGTAVHQSPLPAGSNFSVLTITHYDDYNDVPTGLASTLNSSGYSTYLTASTTSPEFAEPITLSTDTKGMATWTKVKVLGTANQFISTVNIYDRKGRVIQNQTVNVTGGLDVVTSQYSFSGQLLRNHIKHQKLGGTTENYNLATKSNYDAFGRVISTEKNINNSGWKTIAAQTYDALGQLQTKNLGTDPTNTSSPLEQLSYTYNIRGWLLGVNKNEVLTGNGSSARRFGFELGYDKQSNSAGRNYSNAYFNGNINGMIWKSAGDGIRRKYDFNYDNASRLMQGLFEQHNDGGSWSNSTVNYTIKMGDGSNPTDAYDANGNIRKMQQWGLKSLSSMQIDNLTYNYQVNGTGPDLSNKLYRVTDGSNDAQTKLGDFKDGINGNDDYTYDPNGNLSLDQNKAISSIAYNHLNLPQTVTITGKGTINYTYDAAGNKLKKVTLDNTITPSKTTTTLYLFGTYENDVLQFLPQEEGRIRPLRDASANITGFTYDYFLKDHLGNVRMVLTEEQETVMYPAATMETATSNTEEAIYTKLPETRVDKPAGYPYDSYLDPHSKVAKVRGDGQKIGPGVVLKVMAGDKINLRVSSWWKSNGVSPNQTPANPINDLITVLSGRIAPYAIGKASQSDLQGSGLFLTQVQSFLNSRNYSTTKPKAYLQWVFFDEQFKFVASNSGFEQVGSDNVLTAHTRSSLPVDKNGYLYVYTSNETINLDVFFDNLQVTHTKGRILEETHYYPFGLTMAGISCKAMGKQENKSKFNDGTELANKEFSDGSGLDWYETSYRSYDPQIGRFHQIDPLADVEHDCSPYVYANNNPIYFNDPSGLLSDSLHPQELAPVEVVAVRSRNKEASNRISSFFPDADQNTLNNINRFVNSMEGFLPNSQPAGIGRIPDLSEFTEEEELQQDIIIEAATSFLPVSKLLRIPKYVKWLKRIYNGRNAAKASKILNATAKQLQAKFKHAGDFGVVGNSSKANVAKFYAAINQHINNPAVRVIQGTYRGNPATHYLNPKTGLNVISQPNGIFVSGWKLNPAQLTNVLGHGGL